MVFLQKNIGTIVVTALLIIITGLIIRKIVKDKKSGKGCCGDCSSCNNNCVSKQSYYNN